MAVVVGGGYALADDEARIVKILGLFDPELARACVVGAPVREPKDAPSRRGNAAKTHTHTVFTAKAGSKFFFYSI